MGTQIWNFARSRPLALILLLSLSLRLWGLEYALPYFFVGHEWGTATGPMRAITNGSFFPGTLRQGHLFYYILMPQFAIAQLFNELKPGDLLWIARLNVALFGTATVFLTHEIARTFLSKRNAFFAAFVLAITPLHVIWSHYARIDVPATFFLCLCIVLAIRLYQKPTIKRFLGFGFLCGISIAGKLPHALFLAPLFFCVVLLVLLRANSSLSKIQTLQWASLSALLVPIGFGVAMPYAFIKAPEFFGTLIGESKWAQVELAWYPRIYSFGETLLSYFFTSKSTMRASFSLIEAFSLSFLISGFLGFLVALKRNKKEFWILSVPSLLFVAYIISMGKPSTRWFLPAVPLLAVCVAYLGELRPVKKANLTLLLLVICPPAFYRTLRFDWLSTKKDSRVASYEWVKANITPHSKIALFDKYESFPPVYTGPYDCTAVPWVSRNFEGAIAKDRAKSVDFFSSKGIEYFILSSEHSSFYLDPEFESVFPETAASYQGFFNELERKAKLVYENQPNPKRQPGPSIKLYRLPADPLNSR